MKFSSDWFYGGRVVAAKEVEHRGILDFDEQVLARGITLFSAIVYDLAGRA